MHLALLAAAAVSFGATMDGDALRPQFHFTAPKGWLNDPNGLVFYRGEYHLFFQHNPFGTEWGNMTWGHAVSTDLLRWRTLPNALKPDATGTMFSGSAVVDWQNTSGLGTRENPPMVLLYTAAGGTSPESEGVPFTQRVAYSTDGRTFHKIGGAPAVPHIEGGNRDPKVFWHAPSRSWIMALYLDGDRYAILRSPDLKAWTRSGDVVLPGDSECPDLFELPVAGARGKRLWVFWGAAGKYRLGNFDGHRFTPITEPLDSMFGANSYAAQTYSDEPKGRRVQIGWMRGGSYPGMPFNQQMTLPLELTLRQTKAGPRLVTRPVKEVESLREEKIVDRRRLADGLTFDPKGELLELRIRVPRDGSMNLDIGNQMVRYGKGVVTFEDSVSKREGDIDFVTFRDRSEKLISDDGDIEFLIYRDRTSLEVYADGGFLNMPFCFVPTAPLEAVEIQAPVLTSVQAFRLKAAK